MPETERRPRASLRARYGPGRATDGTRADASEGVTAGPSAPWSPDADGAPIRLVLDGEHLQAQDPRFREFLFDLITRAPGCAVHLDMRDVACIDSATLGTLITAYKGAAAVGGYVQVTAASPQVRSVLEITGTDRVLLAPDVDVVQRIDR